MLSRVQLFMTPWIVACQASLSVGIPRQEYWSELLFPTPGDLPDPRIELPSPTFQVNSLSLNHQEAQQNEDSILLQERVIFSPW